MCIKASFFALKVILTPFFLRLTSVVRNKSFQYHRGDIEVVNKIIENNGLKWTLWDSQGAPPDDWRVEWNSEKSRRISTLSLSGSQADSLSGELDFTGLAALGQLYCHGNVITSLQLNGLDQLTGVSIRGGKIAELDFTSCKALEGLSCNNVQLESLKVAGLKHLTRLGSSSNQLTELDLTGLQALRELHCEENQLIELDLEDCTALEDFTCQFNQLSSLKLNKNTPYTSIDVRYNNLPGEFGQSFFFVPWGTANFHLYPQKTDNRGDYSPDDIEAINQIIKTNGAGSGLDEWTEGVMPRSWSNIYWNNEVPRRIVRVDYFNHLEGALDITELSALEAFSCSYGSLESIKANDMANLKSLSCPRQKLQELQVNNCYSLQELDCSGNKLQSLDLSDLDSLTTLECSGNNLTQLKLSPEANYGRIDVRYNYLTKETITGQPIAWDSPKLTEWDYPKDYPDLFFSPQNTH